MKTNILFIGIFILFSISVFAQNNTTSLVAWYPFNGNAKDSTGNNHNGIVSGATLTTDRFGKTNNAYSFNGSSDYIEITATNTLRLPEYTYEAWIYPTANPTGGILATGAATILDIGGEIGDQVLNIGNYNGAYVGISGFGYYVGGGTYNTQTGVLPALNQWYHVVGTRSSTHYKLFVNGILIQSVPLLAIAAEYDVSTLGFIGKRFVNIQYFKGKLDDIRIYNNALTEVQVKELYINESLVAWYPFNGNANDESIIANHSTVHGATLTTDRNNISDKAYNFNGSSDRLQAPINEAYNFGNGDFSITSWVSLNEIKTARIVSAGFKANDGIWGLGIGSHPVWGTGLRINYFIYSGGAYQDFSSDEITGYTLGHWAFVGITKTGNTITFYFNGKKAGTSTISFVSNANSYLSIGSRQEPSGSHIEFLNGKIDEVRIYNRSLSETEISESYNLTRNSLVAYYPFNGNANDESGNGNNGTVYGALLSSDRFGIVGRAYSFNGSTNYIDIGNDPSLKMTEKLSITVWVKPDVFPLSNYHNIISDHGDGNNNTKVLRFYKNAIEFLLGPEGSTEVRYVFPNSIANKWQHITATYDGSFMRLFVNGSIVDSVSRTGTITANPLSLLIAKSHFNEFLPGSIDDIRIYNRPLSITEIKQEYDSTRNPLVAYYPFNGNANDESGSGNHGTIIGTLTSTADRYGVEGKAYRFWHPDYISVPTNSSFFTNEFSVSYWYKVASYFGERGVLSCVGVNGGYQQYFTGTTFSYILGYNFPQTSDAAYSNYIVPDLPNKWHQVTMTYQKTGNNTFTTKLFLNSELKKTDNIMGLTIGYPAGEVFYIGQNHGGVNFNGELDDIRFYNRVLTDAEVLSFYNKEIITSVNNQFLSNINIAPNPTNGHFIIDLGSFYQNIKITISDITGRTIKVVEYSNVLKLNQNIEAPSGIYFINITSENEKATYKLIKK